MTAVSDLQPAAQQPPRPPILELIDVHAAYGRIEVLQHLAAGDTPPPQSRRKTPRELRSFANELVTAFSSSAEAA